MNTKNKSKLNQLLNSWPDPVVKTMPHLLQQGFSRDLISCYLKSHWIEPVGSGAYIRPNVKVSWVGGLVALQKQLRLNIHAGGVSALALSGNAQYITRGKFTVHLFGTPKSKLPAWFKKYDWGVNIQFCTTNLFKKNNFGLIDFKENNVVVKIASKERAILEVLYHVPQEQSFSHASELFENLTTLRPALVQKLLEDCQSIKVKRLFLYFAQKNNYSWFKRINLKKINIGQGKRVIEKNGKLDSQFLITVPKTFDKNHAEQSIFLAS